MSQLEFPLPFCSVVCEANMIALQDSSPQSSKIFESLGKSWKVLESHLSVIEGKESRTFSLVLCIIRASGLSRWDSTAPSCTVEAIRNNQSSRPTINFAQGKVTNYSLGHLWTKIKVRVLIWVASKACLAWRYARTKPYYSSVVAVIPTFFTFIHHVTRSHCACEKSVMANQPSLI